MEEQTPQHYFEIHASAKNQALAADVARHLHGRQYLGRSLVICDNPFALLSAARKQWLRITRAIQLQRARTLNAEEILRLTHAIMHMQHMLFAAREPDKDRDGHVYFVSPDQLTMLPEACHTVYLTTPIADEQLHMLCRKLPGHSLFVNYDTGITLSHFDMLPKSELEATVLKEWEKLAAFLRLQGVQPERLMSEEAAYETVNEALDILLTNSGEFLREAAHFRHAIDLAQPLATISADYIKMFDAVTRLAHRVQTLAPSNFTGFLVKTFGENESFFLRDIATDGYLAYMDEAGLSPYIAGENIY